MSLIQLSLFTLTEKIYLVCQPFILFYRWHLKYSLNLYYHTLLKHIRYRDSISRGLQTGSILSHDPTEPQSVDGNNFPLRTDTWTMKLTADL